MSSVRTEGSRGVPTTRGTVFLHSCTPAIAPHVEWALAGVLDHPVRLQWAAQPAAPTQLSAEAASTGPVGTGAELARALSKWPMLVFEVTEVATAISDGELLAHAAGRGFHRSTVTVNGDVVVGE